MIFTWLLSVVGTVLGFIFGLLPTISLPFFSSPDVTTAQQLGGNGVWLNGFLPVTEALGLMAFFVKIILPAMAIYTGANWAWRHFPDLWGFGPGAG